ncbi:hypothetical protein PVAND_008345 [Polypedilum vanderplanki]|uniref:Chitin-binding type-2 domain-containing protein n=1 Tax=Polypedilum vanderplanki TaxID=319348 RepID=A0A9J6C9X4_POLVA|nr:hypothetical protein PVAND_008345 [Polypedilum vanderplanki]
MEWHCNYFLIILLLSIHNINGRSHGIARDEICEDVPLNTLKIFNDQNVCGKFVACIGQISVHYKCFNNAVYGNGTSDCLMCNETSFLHVYQEDFERSTKINPTKKIQAKKLKNPKTRKTTEIMTTLNSFKHSSNDNQSSKQIDYTAVNDNMNNFNSADYEINNNNDYHDDSLSKKYQNYLENENVENFATNDDQMKITTANISNSNPKPSLIDTNELSNLGQSSITTEYTTTSFIDNYSSERNVIIRKIDSNPTEFSVPNKDYLSTKTPRYDEEGSTKVLIDNESNTETVRDSDEKDLNGEFGDFNTISNRTHQNDNELLNTRMSETDSTSVTNDKSLIDNSSSITLVYNNDNPQEFDNDQNHVDDQISDNKNVVPRNEVSYDEIEHTCFAFHEGGGQRKKITERNFKIETTTAPMIYTENQNIVNSNESFSTSANLPKYLDEEQSTNDSKISQSSHSFEGGNLDASSSNSGDNSTSQDLIDAEKEKKEHERKFSEFFADKTTPTKFTKTRKIKKSRTTTKPTTEFLSFNNSK